MKLVVLESPYAPGRGYTVEQNLHLAREGLRDCLKRGESPIASHLLLTQPGVLLDTVPAERLLGIEAGLAWAKRCDAAVFICDHGWSEGMYGAYRRHYALKNQIEFRWIRGGMTEVTLDEAVERSQGSIAHRKRLETIRAEVDGGA